MKPAKVILTPEQLATQAADRKLAQEKLQAYTNSLPRMSEKQLRGELRREAKAPSDTSLLTQAFATVLGIVMDSKINPYPR